MLVPRLIFFVTILVVVIVAIGVLNRTKVVHDWPIAVLDLSKTVLVTRSLGIPEARQLADAIIMSDIIVSWLDLLDQGARAAQLSIL